MIGTVGRRLLVAVVTSSAGMLRAEPPALRTTADASASGERAPRMWVYFRDKGPSRAPDRAAALQGAASTLSERAVQRRILRRSAPGLLDERDLPVCSTYLDELERCGATVHIASRWLNAASVIADPQTIDRIAALPFVQRIEPVRGARRDERVAHDESPSGCWDLAWEINAAPSDAGGRTLDYGETAAQIAQVNLAAVHDAGYTGQNVVIGVLDTGFHLGHEAFNQPGHVVDVMAAYDFINDDANVDNQPGDPDNSHQHGTYILGVMAAWLPGRLIGAAPNASFILCKTEDVAAEYPAEEDNFVAGLEFIEANGGDLATASLGYIDWYTQADLDGQTAVTTIAVNIATANGMPVLSAAGNEGHDGDPGASHLIAPADGLESFAVGAVDASGVIAGFSSDGPSADGRVKPEILARGVDTRTVCAFSDANCTTGPSGTSLSTPLAAGALGCLIGGHPEWSVTELRSRVLLTASYYAASETYDPNYVLGYGILNAHAALNLAPCPGDTNADWQVDNADLQAVLDAWASRTGDPNYDAAADLNDDGHVENADLQGILDNWARGCP